MGDKHRSLCASIAIDFALKIHSRVEAFQKDGLVNITALIAKLRQYAADAFSIFKSLSLGDT